MRSSTDSSRGSRFKLGGQVEFSLGRVAVKRIEDLLKSGSVRYLPGTPLLPRGIASKTARMFLQPLRAALGCVAAVEGNLSKLFVATLCTVQQKG